MNIDYAMPLKKAFTFCMEPKRWVPFFIVDLAFLSVGLSLVLSNSMLLFVMAGVQDMSLLGSIAALFLELLALFAAWLLIGIYITGALIHQSHKEKEFKRSWKVSRTKYLSLLGVSFVTAVIAFLTAMIPVVGWLISIFVGLVFFFGLQGVIVKGHGFVDALEDSWHIFKTQPFKVFLMWVLIAVLSIIILAIFALPLIALVFRIAIDLAGAGGASTATLMELIYTIENQLPQLVVSGIIFVLGMAITRSFSLKAQTEFYLQMRKAK